MDEHAIDPADEARHESGLARFSDQTGRHGFGWIEWNQPQPS